jgi:hypothetical protein
MVGLAHHIDFRIKTAETSCVEVSKAQGPTS